jgi:hypothetical protein
VLLVALERPQSPRRVAAGPLDLDHVGAEVGEQAGCVGPGDVLRKVEHDDVVEGLHGSSLRGC